MHSQQWTFKSYLQGHTVTSFAGQYRSKSIVHWGNRRLQPSL